MPVSPAELFERHHLVVYRYLLRMTGLPHVAEDLAQEVFLRVVRGMHDYDDRGHERAWLICIARNVLIDHQRKSRREPAGVVSDVALSSPDPDVGLGVRQALDRLPEADREAFVMRAVVGLGHEDIAELVGATPASVRSRIYRARAAPKSMLQ